MENIIKARVFEPNAEAASDDHDVDVPACQRMLLVQDLNTDVLSIFRHIVYLAKLSVYACVSYSPSWNTYDIHRCAGNACMDKAALQQ